MVKNFLEARKTLLKACEGYIEHNQHELNHLKAQGHGYPPIFYSVFSDTYTNEPALGFNNWVCCEYYYLLTGILGPFKYTDSPYCYFKGGEYRYPFEEMKWWRGDYNVNYDQTVPETVLHNLNALFNVLNFHMEKKFPDLAQKKIALNYHENDLTALRDAPLSTRIYKTFENLKLRANFAKSIMKNKGWLESVCNALENDTPVFEGYIKGVAVRELRVTLKNSDLEAKEAIKCVEEQLKKGITIELLKKNRQSETEKNLKLLSVIFIFAGIGIFTTLGLVFKRLYDSGGTSINFFKPLSQNLCEDIEGLTSDWTEEEPLEFNPF